MMGFAVSEAQSKALSDAVMDLVVQADALFALVCERSGVVIAQTEPPEAIDSDTVAALSAGATAATQELARHIRATGFDSIAHKGAERSMFVQVVCEEFMILVIFDSTTTLGLVKLYVGQTVDRLAPVLREIQAGGDAPQRGVFELQEDGDFFQAAAD